MRLLFDQNISFRLIHRISDVFAEAKQVRDVGLENASDREIWDYAKSHSYTIVTFDSDFYDFSLVWGHPPKIVWLRTYDNTTQGVEALIRKHESTIRAFADNDELACLEIINV